MHATSSETTSLTQLISSCVFFLSAEQSVAFYPSKGLVCYGSEQAAGKSNATCCGDMKRCVKDAFHSTIEHCLRSLRAVKAGIKASFPGQDTDVLGLSRGELDNDAFRLDLDVSK